MIDKLENSVGSNIRSIVVVLILLLATYLRFRLIDSQSLWYDEGNSARMILRSSEEIVASVAADVHPPAYYLLLKTWAGMIGGSEFGLRSLSAFAGLLVVSVMYVLGCKLGNHLVASLAGIIGAIHPGLVYYSQEVRMYMVCTLLSAILIYISVRLSSLRKIGRVFRVNLWHISFVLCATTGLYVHYAFGFILFAVYLEFAYEMLTIDRKYRRSFMLELVCLQVGILIFYMPWLSTAIEHLTSWPAERVSLPLVIAIWEVWNWLALGPTVEATETVLGLVCLGVIVVIGLARDSKNLFCIALWMIAPIGLILIFGLFSEAFEKFLVLSVPAVAIIAASGFARLIQHLYIPARILAFLILTIVLSYTYVSLDNLYYNEYYRRDDYRGVVANIVDDYRDGDAVLLNAPNQAEVIEYYYPSMAHVFPVARARPFDAEIQILELEEIASDHSRLKSVFWGDEQADPDGVVEQWLNSNAYKTSERWYGHVRLMEYNIAEERQMQEIDANFDEIVRLERYGLNSQLFRPGDVVQVTLDWSTARETSSRYKVFIHVYSNTNLPPVAQHDSEPVGGSMPTNIWVSNEVITDMHGVSLPSDIQVGEYTLAVGMYSVEDGERLRVIGDKNLSDRLVLTKISIVE